MLCVIHLPCDWLYIMYFVSLSLMLKCFRYYGFYVLIDNDHFHCLEAVRNVNFQVLKLFSILIFLLFSGDILAVNRVSAVLFFFFCSSSDLPFSVLLLLLCRIRSDFVIGSASSSFSDFLL